MQKTYSEYDDGIIESRVQSLLKARWDQGTSIKVLEVEEDGRDFEAVSPEYRDPDDNKVDNIAVRVNVPMQQLNFHTVKPEKRWCSCGSWQDIMIPYQHAMAVYMLHLNIGSNLTLIKSEQVGDYHKIGCVKNIQAIMC